MNLLRISNLFNLLVQGSTFFRSYHFGYASDIDRNVPNNFDPNNETGKFYPHVAWIAPPEGAADLRRGMDEVEIEIRFYDLLDYKNDGDPVAMSETMLKRWDALKREAFVFISAIRMSKQVGQSGTVKWFSDSHVGSDRLICIGATVTLQQVFSCADIEAVAKALSEGLPAIIPDALDLEAL